MRTLYTLAAAVLLTLYCAGVIRAQDAPQKQAGAGYGDLKEVTLKGKLISLAEELSRKYGSKTAGAGPEKQWAFATPKGEIYTFLDNEQYRKLLAAKLQGGIEVKARLIPRSMLLEVTGFRKIPDEEVHQRFFCEVCNIYTEDWGPCVCCGREMMPIDSK